VLAPTVSEAARRYGDRSAVVAPDGWELSYRDLDWISDEVAAHLLERGLGPGSTLALALPPCPEFTILYAAAAKVGAATAGINHRLTPPERLAVAERAAADLLLTPSGETLGTDSEQVTLRRVDGPSEVLAGLREPGGVPPPLPDDPDRPVAIVFTSGTTGTPRGAVFASRQLAFIRHIDTGDQWSGRDAPTVHTLAATAITHLGSMTKLPGNLLRGVTIHQVERWRAADALAITSRFAVSTIAGIPTQVALMLRDPTFDSTDLSCVRSIVVGGGPATRSLLEEARERLGVPLAVRYSCTEAGIGLGTAIDDPPEDALESVGRPHPGVVVTIRDRDGRLLDAGEIGEVCLSSPAVMSGYHRDAEASAAVRTTDGAVRTGDLGLLDDQGRLVLRGRTREMYIRGGFNIYPVEVEGVLAEHPEVAEVAIVARPDDVMGEIGVAVVVARKAADPPTLEDLRTFAAEQVAAHKLPEDLRLVSRMPLTAMDKVDRCELKRRVARTENT